MIGTTQMLPVAHKKPVMHDKYAFLLIVKTEAALSMKNQTVTLYPAVSDSELGVGIPPYPNEISEPSPI